MNFGLTGIVGRIATAVFYGVCVFVVVYIVGIILGQFPVVAEVGSFLKQWAALLGLLAGLVAFFTGTKPTV